MQTCEQCKWWKAPMRDDQGTCNRFPQQVKTHKSYVCGEFYGLETKPGGYFEEDKIQEAMERRKLRLAESTDEMPEGIVSEAVLNLLTPEKLRGLYTRAEVDRSIFDAVPDPSRAQSESETAAPAPLPPVKPPRRRSSSD